MIIHVLTNPVISLQPGILGILRGGKQLCQGGKPKLNTDVCSAHTSECVVDGLGTTVAYWVLSQSTGVLCI